jgi:hypothetical protein
MKNSFRESIASQFSVPSKPTQLELPENLEEVYEAFAQIESLFKNRVRPDGQESADALHRLSGARSKSGRIEAVERYWDSLLTLADFILELDEKHNKEFMFQLMRMKDRLKSKALSNYRSSIIDRLKSISQSAEKLISSHGVSHDYASNFIKGELERSGLKDAWIAYQSTK